MELLTNLYQGFQISLTPINLLYCFVGVLLGTLALVTALSFFPPLALGPIVEHLLMLAGRSVS